MLTWQADTLLCRCVWDHFSTVFIMGPRFLQHPLAGQSVCLLSSDVDRISATKKGLTTWTPDSYLRNLTFKPLGLFSVLLPYTLVKIRPRRVTRVPAWGGGGGLNIKRSGRTQPDSAVVKDSVPGGPLDGLTASMLGVQYHTG